MTRTPAGREAEASTTAKNPAPIAPAPPPEQPMVKPPQIISVYRCAKGHTSPAIGLYFSAAMLSAPPDQAQTPIARDRRYCFVCLIEALHTLGVSEVERLEA
jgi:hypothetical protein